MQVKAQTSGWEAFHADRVERRDAATDEATRKHFEAEIQQALVTMKAMGIEPADGGKPAPETETKSPDPSASTYDVNGDGRDGVKFVNPTGSDSGTLPAAFNNNLDAYRDDILAASKATGVPAELLAAVIWDESKGVAGAGSVNGENGLTDSGLMQINPDTFAALKAKHPDLLTGDASDPKTNIMAGALYLKEQYDQFGDWDLALRAYNSGPLSVDPSDASISTTGFGTQNYVEKVSFYQDLISRGEQLPDGFPGGNVYY